MSTPGKEASVPKKRSSFDPHDSPMVKYVNKKLNEQLHLGVADLRENIEQRIEDQVNLAMEDAMERALSNYKESGAVERLVRERVDKILTEQRVVQVNTAVVSPTNAESRGKYKTLQEARKEKESITESVDRRVKSQGNRSTRPPMSLTATTPLPFFFFPGLSTEIAGLTEFATLPKIA